MKKITFSLIFLFSIIFVIIRSPKIMHLISILFWNDGKSAIIDCKELQFKKNYEIQIKPKLKSTDYYELFITNNENRISEEVRFEIPLAIKLKKDDLLFKEYYIKKPIRKIFVKNSSEYFKKIILLDFKYPFNGLLFHPVNIEIKVLNDIKEDHKEFHDVYKVCISRSSYL